MSSYYENYRRGIIERHRCRNGRDLQATLLCQRKKEPAPEGLPHRRTTEHLPDGVPIAYEGWPVVLDGKVVGGGDNPLLSGGLLMMMFAIEDILGVSKHSLHYCERLLCYFESSQVAPGKLYRKRNWWRQSSPASKDEMTGLLLGLDFYMQAVRRRGLRAEEARIRRLMTSVGSYLQRYRYEPAFSWVFQFPFTRLFKFNLGMSMLSGTTIPPNPSTGDSLMDSLLKILKAMSLLNWWYKPKHLYRDTMRFLPRAYQGTVALNQPKKFFNVALYCHTVQMIFNKPVKSKIRKEMWGAFQSFFNYFAIPGGKAGQGDGAENALLGVVAHAFANSVGSPNLVARAKKMYATILKPEGRWAPNLPIFCLEGSTRFRHYYAGDEKRLWGERFTWEHSDTKGHFLQWHWPKVLGSIGPPGRIDLKDVGYADQSKGFVVEAVGLGLPVVRALAAYYGLAPPPKLEASSTLAGSVLL